MEVKQKFLQMNTFHIALKLKRAKKVKHLKNTVNLTLIIISLLILLANDVHTNPGPGPLDHKEDTTQQCIMCNKLATNEDAYRCDTCNHWSHLVCSGTNNSLQRSFEWICLKSNCSPNHVEVTPKTGSENQLVSPNRYRLIEKVNENLANLN